jgi:hypothetical protein
MTIDRFRVHWTGFPGAPGVNTLFFADPTDPGTAFSTFFNSIKALLPTSVTVSFDAAGDKLDEVSGAITGGWTGASGTAITGSVSALYPGPAGAVVILRTNTVINRRRLMGKMFLVPLCNDAYQADGTIATSALGTLQTAADTLLASGVGANWKVWHRPVGGTGGSIAAVSAATVTDKVVVLRSRRD